VDDVLFVAAQAQSRWFGAEPISTRVVKKLTNEPPSAPILQYLRHGGWVKVSDLPDAPRKIVKLMGLGWIERNGSGSEVSFRITDAGLEELKKPIPLR